MSKVREYEGRDILVHFDLKRCIHAEECVNGLPDVFAREARPWVKPDGATADDIAEVILRCPTGALKYERKDGGPSEPLPKANTIAVEPDGPLYVNGQVELMRSDGSRHLEDTRVALCRCGASKNKPLCDGHHEDAGFADSGQLGAITERSADFELGGKLTITPAHNGPFLLQGTAEIEGSDGRTSYHDSKAALCRCGGSNKKPFCDGTHKKIGFMAD
jgi:CDGSH-type Zn-finger protein/uncharacterized Fe-S cluster protein YjdI